MRVLGVRVDCVDMEAAVARIAALIEAGGLTGCQPAGAGAGGAGPAGAAGAGGRIRAARPDRLRVAYGHPRQERGTARNREHLPAPVAMGVGGAFDFASGRLRRAPAW